MNEDAPGWHLKREIQLGHLITTLTVAISAAVFVLKIDQRLAIVENRMTEQIKGQHDRDERQDVAARESLALLRSQLGRMDEKLDRLIERRNERTKP